MNQTKCVILLLCDMAQIPEKSERTQGQQIALEWCIRQGYIQKQNESHFLTQTGKALVRQIIQVIE